MKWISIVLMVLCIDHQIIGQSWQQQVDYTMDVKLDDVHHKLMASQTIQYHNHSDHAIADIKIHLWMNAFKAKKSAFSTQLYDLGINSKLILSKDEEGGYEKISVRQNDVALEIQYETESQEIANIHLSKPIGPHRVDSLNLTWELKLPKNISRGGHLGQAYQLTQWYPKVALLDTNGWHTMSYLEFGEFFNEFGNYRVNITLPKNYKLGATGVLLNEDEKNWLINQSDTQHLQNIITDISYPPSSHEWKTVSYEATRVIDFAWFADKRFLIQYARTKKSHQDSIDLWAFYYKRKYSNWDKSIDYMDKALLFMESNAGDYPYEQITAVECLRDGSEAMEYPMITLIDRSYQSSDDLEKVILHEIAHNWFQAVLANNEREEAWLDEGLVSFYEQKYKGRKSFSILDRAPYNLKSDYTDVPDFNWYVQAADQNDLSSADDIKKYSLTGYLSSVYEKPAKGLFMVEKTLGKDAFKNMMHGYFEKYRFKHPSGKDFASFLQGHGIPWYDSLYILTNGTVDVKLTHANGTISIQNDNHLTVPVEIAGFNKNQKEFSSVMILDPFQSKKINIANSFDYILADPDFLLPETDRKNNLVRLKSNGLTPKKTRVSILPGLGSSVTGTVYIHPTLVYNHHDGAIAGITLHNIDLPKKDLQYGIQYGYGFHSKKPVLLGGAQYSIYTKSAAMDRMDLNLELRNFSTEKLENTDLTYRYFKIAPSIKARFKSNTQQGAQSFLSYRWIHIDRKDLALDANDAPLIPSHYQHHRYNIHEIKYTRTNHKTLAPFDLTVMNEWIENHPKVSLDFIKRIPYSFIPGKFAEIHLFGGVYDAPAISTVQPYFTINGLNLNQYDYKFDEFFLGRNVSGNTTFAQQIFSKDAGINSRVLLKDHFNSMVSCSIKSGIPGPFPIYPYAQLAFAGNKSFYTTGASIAIVKDILELNFPFYESKNIRQSYKDSGITQYVRKCTFLLNFKGLNPMKWIDRVSR